MSSKPVVFIVYDYFFPGYKAGGPVQSLTNLITSLQDRYSFFVLTTAYDLMADTPYDSVLENQWNDIALPNAIDSIKVWYAGRGKPSIIGLIKLFRQTNPQIIYLNGIYSFRLFVLPLILNFLSPKMHIVVCPRGMLQRGALSIKSGKKKYYIKALQKTRLLQTCTWHATNQEELLDIEAYFPVNQGVFIAPNIPKTPQKTLSLIVKKPEELSLVYLSLITEKKNLLLLLTLFQQLPETIQLDIYGPVKDEQYWEQCKRLIEQMPNKVKYLGDVFPEKVQKTLAQYHAMIILTKGENFGHALYESLSVGRPLITSFFTPWNNLEETKAGLNLDVAQAEDCVRKIRDFASVSQVEYNEFCQGALVRANQYFKQLKTTEFYEAFFG